jgi:hypothetical protein
VALMFGMGCVHQWRQEARTFAAPANQQGVSGLRYFTHDEAMRYLHGVTTFVYRCTDCGELRKIECLGREVTP